MNAGGAINLRLSLKGAEQVRAELASIGPAGTKMGQELDRAMRTPGPGLQALDTGMKSARGGLEGFAGRIGPVGSGLAGLGAAGLAAAAGVTAAVLAAAAALQQARGAVLFAEEITDAAGKINIGVEALQEWRFAAEEAGVAAADADSAIDSFQRKLGEAMAGGRSVKWFERLGFSAADLKAFEGTEDALDAVIDRIAGLGTEAERAAVADKLGLSPLIPLVRQGADAIEEMRARARELGLVMEADMIERGDKAGREMEILSHVIDMQLKQAFIDLGPVIVTVMGLVAQLASALNDLSNSWKAFEQKSSDYLRKEDDRLKRGITSLLDRAGVDTPTDLSPSERTVFDRMNDRRGRIAAQLSDRAAEAAAAPAPSPVAPTVLRDVSGGGGGGADRDAERAERETERRRQAAEREIENLLRTESNAKRAHLREVEANTDTAAARASAARALLELDEAEERAALEKARATITAAGMMDAEEEARFGQIEALRADVAAARRRRIEEEQAERESEALLDAQEEFAHITADLLSIASANARTADERRGIELELLQLAQARRRADLQSKIAAESEAEARANLVAALKGLDVLERAERGEVERRHSGPVDRWRDAQIQSFAEFEEFATGEVLSALDGVSRGLIDAWRNAESAGDAFSRMGDVAVDALSRIVDALLEVALQRMLIEPMINALFGTGQGGGRGGLLGSFLGNLGGSLFGGGFAPKPGGGAVTVTGSKGFSAGGTVGARGLYPVGERGIELLDLPPGAIVHDSERSRRLVADMAGGWGAGMRTPVASQAPIVNMPVTIVNKTSEPVAARTTQTSQGIDVILEPVVRAGVARMGRDGSLAAAAKTAPPPIRR